MLLDGVQDAQILNMNFRNSGDPGDVPLNGNVYPTAFSTPANVSQALVGQQTMLDQIMADPATQFTWVTAVDPYSGVGIAIHESSGVVVQGCNFDHMFIGVAGISTSLDPAKLDQSRDIVIVNCTASQFGF